MDCSWEAGRTRKKDTVDYPCIVRQGARVPQFLLSVPVYLLPNSVDLICSNGPTRWISLDQTWEKKSLYRHFLWCTEIGRMLYKLQVYLVPSKSVVNIALFDRSVTPLHSRSIERGQEAASFRRFFRFLSPGLTNL